MGVLDGEIWVCAECRSINNARAKQCYNCRTPRDLAAVDPTTIEGTGHGRLRDVALPAFRSPRPYAVVASILVLATGGLQLVYVLDVASLAAQIIGGVAATEEQLRFLSTLGLASFGLAVVALVGWSLWLSHVVSAMPALGLGYPAATGTTAFVENFLPGLNLLRVPAIVRDVIGRVAPGKNRGEALIFVAWIALIGGFVIPRVSAVVSGLSAESPESVLRTQTTVALVSTGVVLVGAVMLVALIWWIEEGIARRREAQLAAIDAATAGATEETAESTDDGGSVPYPVTPVPGATAPVPDGSTAVPDGMPSAQAPAASSPWSWRDSGDSPLAASTGQALAAAAAAGPGWDNEFAPAAVASAPLPERVTPEPAAPPAADPVVVTEPERVPSAASNPDAAPPTPLAPDPEPEPEPTPDEPPTVAAAVDRAPHLTIRVTSRGMLQAELGGDTEPVILEDLSAYGNALADAGGTAEIVLAGNDGMVGLIARRAQRILADAGIEATIPH